MTTTAISTPPTIPSPMLSVAEACEYLKVRKSFLYVLIGSGDLPARKLRTRTFILKSDVDDLIESLPQIAFRGRGPALAQRGVDVIDAAAVEYLSGWAEDGRFRGGPRARRRDHCRRCRDQAG